MEEAVVNQSSQLAMDLARFDRRTRVQEAVAADDLRAVPRSLPRTRAAAGARVQGITLGVRLSSVILFVYFMGIALLIVFSYAQLHGLSQGNERLSKDLRAAAQKQGVLAADFESKIKLEEITEIAVNELGMVKLDPRQITYINMAGKEKVEIFSDALTFEAVKLRLSEALEVLLEYFR